MSFILDRLSQMTGLSRKTVIQGIFIILLILVFLGFGQAFLANFIGVVYPCFMSFFALETEQADDDKQWLTYWVVFGFMSLVDQFAGVFLTMIPFYYVLKIIILIWLFHPHTQGAITIYDHFIYPLWKEHEEKIDKIGK
jgi:receptor expression-enhancing protein 5/6